MGKKTIVLIIGCFLGSITVVLLLQLNAAGPNLKKNNFVRVFPPHFFGTPSNIDLKNSEYYIAGVTEESVYLGNYTDATIFSELDWKASHRRDFHLPLSSQKNFFSYILHLSVDSPWLYVNNSVTGSVFRGRIAFPEIPLSELNIPRVSSSIFIPISSESFGIRTFDSKRNQNILGKLYLDSTRTMQVPGLLEEQSEGVFSTDGILAFNATSARGVYIYFYRNQFICIDSNFKLLYHANTLDTNAHAKIRVVDLPSQYASTIASPGFRVNRAACISAEWIFVHSDLRADNEEENIFNENVVFDVYSLKDGHYHFSFYLPKFKGNITDLAIQHQDLVVMQGDWLRIYPLNMGEIRIPSSP